MIREEQTNKNSIRLSRLNSTVREKVEKFDISNDGSLEIEEALAAIITLQKQSNNYKKILYLAFPLIAILLLCMLGINILSIKLTKEVKVKNNGSPSLTDTNGRVLSTVTYSSKLNMIEWIYNINKNINTLQAISFGDTNLKLIGTSINNNNNATSITLITSNNMYITVNSNMTYSICDNTIDDCSSIKGMINENIKRSLDNMINIISSTESSKMSMKDSFSFYDLPYLVDGSSIISEENENKNDDSAHQGFGCTISKCNTTTISSN